MLPTLFLAVTTMFAPPRPTVGDLITIDFPAPAEVQASSGYEIVSRTPRRVVVRTFEPKTFVVHTSTGEVTIPIRSVLRPNDKLDPAPLKPPLPEPYPRAPFVAIAIAALAAIAVWTAVVVLARRRIPKPEIILAPADRFRAAVQTSRRWAELADATRAYLAAVDPRLGPELTTTELLEIAQDPTIAEILRQGDLEKFSPWGARPGDFHALSMRALTLIPEPQAEELAA